MPVSDQGSSAGRYTLVPRTLIFLHRGNGLLLIKGASHKRLWAGLYNGIGGHIERGEDVLSAARREVLEETGLKVLDLQLCGTVIVDTTPGTGIIIFVFNGECPEGEPCSSREGSIEWVAFSQIGQLPMVEDLPVLLPHVLTTRSEDPPFFAFYAYDSQGKLIIRFTE